MQLTHPVSDDVRPHRKEKKNMCMYAPDAFESIGEVSFDLELCA